MTRGWGLIAAGIAMVVLLLAMSPAEDRMQANGPGMVTFELTGGQDRADEILVEWGEEGRDAAREQLWIDFGFMLAYGTFLTLALLMVRDLARKRGWRRLATVGGVVVYFGALAAGFDAIENVCLLLTLGGAGGALPLLATIFASCKFILLAGAIGYLVVGLAMRLLNRGSAAALPLGLVALALVVGPTSAAEARIRCELRADPSRAGAGRLLIRATGFEEVIAVAPGPNGQIFVSDDQRMKPLGCRGGRPTTDSVETVEFRANRQADNSALFIAEAPRFGSVDFVLHGRALGLGIGGTDAGDAIALGTAGGAAAVDFAADPDPVQPSYETAAVDVRAFAKLLTIVVRGGRGGDLIDASPARNPASSFDGPLRAHLTAYGEGGNDVVTTGAGSDYVDCGPGRDQVHRDRSDEVEGCERIRVR